MLKSLKDCLKASLKSLGIELNTWEMLAQDRPAWRGKLSSGARTAEGRRIRKAQTKHAVRKARATSTATSAPAHMRVGLLSLDWTHQPPPDPQPATIHLILEKSWSSLTAEGRTTTTTITTIRELVYI